MPDKYKNEKPGQLSLSLLSLLNCPLKEIEQQHQKQLQGIKTSPLMYNT